jgi:hypothetical protein
MQEFIDNLGPVGDTLLTVLIALGILILGWIIARIVARVVRGLLRRMKLDDRLANAVSTQNLGFSVEDLTGRAVFWIIMLFAAVAVLQRVNLPGAAEPIQSLLTNITTDYLPAIGGAILLLLLAWGIATVLRLLIVKGATMLKMDQRLTQYAALAEGEEVKVSESFATAVFWFIFLLFLPAVLETLGITSIATPLQNMFAQALDYVPNIFAAVITLLIGWFIARILRQIITNLLAAVGIDNVGKRINLSGERSLSWLVGTFVYTFILLLTIIQALDALNIAAVSEPATRMLTTIINAIPSVAGAIVVLVVSYYIGRLVGDLVADLLKGIGINSWPAKLGLNYSGNRTLSELIGYLILIVIMLFATLSAAELLGSAFLTDILATFIGFMGQVVLAVIIFAIGLYLANLARSVIVSTGGNRAAFTANVARVAILVLAGAMALRQLGVADDIVNLAFGIMLGALGIAAALAFGLGSRDVAGREVERFVSSLRENEE